MAILGSKAGLYYAAAGETDIENMTLVANVKDVTIGEIAGEADSTTRANANYRGTTATLKENDVGFAMVYESSDAALAAIYAAYDAGTTLAFAAMTELKSVIGSTGIIADYSVLDVSKEQPLEDIQLVNVALKLETFRSRHTVS